MSPRRGATSVWAAVSLLSACGEPDRARLDVYAASSLTEPFHELETIFERAHPGSEVVLTLAGSQVLRVQIEEGAPAQVFASANPEHLQALVGAGIMGGSRPFAGNELVVIVPDDNPAGIHVFHELPRARRLVLGTPDVPVGRYAREILAAADARLRPGFEAAVLDGLVSEEPNVRLARAKVELGEADAAIVYVTDAAGSERIRTIPIPEELNVRAEYRIGVVERGRPDGSAPAVSTRLAEAWVDLVLSAAGQAVLERHGFAVQ